MHIPHAPVGPAPPRQVGAAALAVVFDPSIFRLRVFAANEYASTQRSAGPPIAGREANGNLHCKGDNQMFKFKQGWHIEL
jgi:hypothetical protein